MTPQEKNTTKVPRWLIVVIVIASLPMLGYPWLLAFVHNHIVPGVDDEMFHFMVHALPVYVAGTLWVSYKIYAERPVLMWVLLSMLFICYIACVWMVCQGLAI